MAYLNVNIPTIYAKVKKEYLYDLDPKYKKESLDCIIFGVKRLRCLATGFLFLLGSIMVIF